MTEPRSQHCRPLETIAIVIVICACIVAGTLAPVHADEPAFRSIGTTRSTTSWSAPVSGVKLRVAFDSVTLYTDPVMINLSLESYSSTSSSPVIIAADNSKLRLRLTDAASGDSHTVTQMLFGHAGDSIVLKEGVSWDSLVSFKVDCDFRIVDFSQSNRDSVFLYAESPLVPVHESLPVGRYLAQIELYVPETNSDGWHGLLVSPVFPVLVQPTDPTLRAQTFLFPRRYRFERGPIAIADTAAMDTVSIVPSPNRYLTYYISSNIGQFAAPGQPVSPTVLLNNDVPLPRGEYSLLVRPKSRAVFVEGRLDLRLHCEVYENDVYQGCPCYCSLRNPKHVLWERDVDINITREEYDSLLIPEWELYDYHTLIVPTLLECDLDDTIRFSTLTAHLREVRIPKGYCLCTAITFDTHATIWQDHPPQTPLTVMPPARSFDTLRIDIYARNQSSVNATAQGILTDTIRVWSGYALSLVRCSSVDVTETFYLRPEQSRPIRSLYIPGYLLMSDDLVLTACDTGLIEVALPRTPATAVVASVTIGDNCWTVLPPDLAGVRLNSTSGSFIGDTLVCKFDLYECRVESTAFGGHSSLYSRMYKVPLDRKLHRKLWELMQKQPVKYPHGSYGIMHYR